MGPPRRAVIWLSQLGVEWGWESYQLSLDLGLGCYTSCRVGDTPTQGKTALPEMLAGSLPIGQHQLPTPGGQAPSAGTQGSHRDHTCQANAGIRSSFQGSHVVKPLPTLLLNLLFFNSKWHENFLIPEAINAYSRNFGETKEENKKIVCSTSQREVLWTLWCIFFWTFLI